MGNRRFRNRIKSIVGSLVDPDKDEQLKGSNTETEENYRRILNIVKENDQEDKKKLVGLIEEFHSRYNSIYERYDHITRKLKERVQSKKEKQSSSSSSSDSDSEGSSHKNGSKNWKIHIAAEIDELERKLAVETEEKEAVNLQLQETEEMLNQSKLQYDRLLEEHSKILNENRELSLKLEDIVVVETELNQKVEDMEKEKASLLFEKEASMATVDELTAIIVQLKGEKEGFESELQSLQWEFTEMKNKLTTTEDELSNLIQKLEITEFENRSFLEKIDNLQKELELICTQKRESDYLIECLREEITNKNGDQERLLEERSVHVAEIKQLQEKIDEMSDEIQNSLRSKDHIVEQLEETIEDLKGDLEVKGDEVSSLTETVRNLEVKIRLSTQKLRVTEQMLNETEHDHATKEEKLHQENKTLMEKISTLSETISNMKREVQEIVNETLTGVDSLTVKFEEDYGHVTTRVNELTNEIHAMQVQLKQMRDDLIQKYEETVTKINFSEGENERLVKSLEEMKMISVEKDEKINELENTIHVKDEWISGFCKDKREAIKQLCIWADYYRDRSDHLQQQLLHIATGGRRQTVR